MSITVCLLEGAFAEHQFFMGKGAGGNATGSAVLSDISALTYDYRYEYKKLNQHLNHSLYPGYRTGSFMSVITVHIKPDPDDFKSISVKHESPGFNYLIGKINLARLKQCGWLRRSIGQYCAY